MKTTLAERPARMRRLLRDFDRATARVRPFFVERFGDEADAMISLTRAEYALLLPRVPWVGGRANPWTWNLEGAAMWVAMWRVLKPRGWTAERAGALFHDTMAAWLATYPPRYLRLLGRLRMGRLRQARLRRAARRTQELRYEGNYVARFVEGSPRYAFGLDFVECGIVKLLRAEGAEEIAPYLCDLDLPWAAALGISFDRTTTLARGGRRCDFRFLRQPATA